MFPCSSCGSVNIIKREDKFFCKECYSEYTRLPEFLEFIKKAYEFGDFQKAFDAAVVYLRTDRESHEVCLIRAAAYTEIALKALAIEAVVKYDAIRENGVTLENVREERDFRLLPELECRRYFEKAIELAPEDLKENYRKQGCKSEMKICNRLLWQAIVDVQWVVGENYDCNVTYLTVKEIEGNIFKMEMRCRAVVYAWVECTTEMPSDYGDNDRLLGELEYRYRSEFDNEKYISDCEISKEEAESQFDLAWVGRHPDAEDIYKSILWPEQDEIWEEVCESYDKRMAEVIQGEGDPDELWNAFWIGYRMSCMMCNTGCKSFGFGYSKSEVDSRFKPEFALNLHLRQAKLSKDVAEKVISLYELSKDGKFAQIVEERYAYSNDLYEHAKTLNPSIEIPEKGVLSAEMQDALDAYKAEEEAERQAAEEAERQKQEQAQVQSQSNGCYVATAVYGSYDCPEVWTLRRFRDDILAEHMFGRAFIRTYYAVSPTLVKWFGEAEWFKKLWKPKLDNLVNKLENLGVENTPYNDKNWR